MDSVRKRAEQRRTRTYPVVLRLWVTYTAIGGAYRSLGFYGLRLPR